MGFGEWARKKKEEEEREKSRTSSAAEDGIGKEGSENKKATSFGEWAREQKGIGNTQTTPTTSRNDEQYANSREKDRAEFQERVPGLEANMERRKDEGQNSFQQFFGAMWDHTKDLGGVYGDAIHDFFVKDDYAEETKRINKEAKDLYSKYISAEAPITLKRDSGKTVVDELNGIKTELGTMEQALQRLETAYKNNPSDVIAKQYDQLAQQYNQKIEAHNALYAEYEPQFKAYSDAANAYDAYIKQYGDRITMPADDEYSPYKNALDALDSEITRLGNRKAEINRTLGGLSRAGQYGGAGYMESKRKELADELAAIDAQLLPLEARRNELVKEGGYLSDDDSLGQFAYGGERTLAAVLGLGENVNDFAAETIYGLMEGVTSLDGRYPNAVSRWAGDAYDKFAGNSITADYEESIRQRYKPTPEQEKITGFGQTVTQVALPIALGYGVGQLAGLGSAATTGTLGATNTAKVANTATKAIFGAHAGGAGVREAHAEGASHRESLAFGWATAAMEMSIEEISGVVPGLPDGSKIAKAVEKVYSDPRVIRVLSNPVVSRFVGGAGEAGEEVLSAVFTPYLKRAFYDPNAALVTEEEIKEQAIMGGLASLCIGAGIDIPTYVAESISARNRLAVDEFDAETIRGIIETGLESPADSVSHKLATELQQKGDSVTAQEIMGLYNENVKQVNAENAEQGADEAIMDAAREAVGVETISGDAVQGVQEVSRENDTQPVQSENAVEAARNAARTMTMERWTGYGEHGTKTFTDLVEEMNADPMKVRKSFQAAYEAGLANVPRSKINLLDTVQATAYNAGQMDKIALDAKDRKAGKVTVREDAGFVYDTLPADVTPMQAKAVDMLAKATGVRVQIAKGLKGNAEIRDDGTVLIAEDFEREVKGKKRSIVFYAAHEIGMHRLMQLAPKEGRAFINALIADKNSALPYGAHTDTELKQSNYAQQNVSLTIDKAMEEVSADAVLGLYEDEEAFFAAIDRIMNGTNEQAKKGARTFKQWLDDTVRKLKQIVAKLSGKERTQVQETLNEVTALRDLYERALTAAVNRAKTGKVANETGRAVDGRGTMDYSMKENYVSPVYETLETRTPIQATDFKADKIRQAESAKRYGLNKVEASRLGSYVGGYLCYHLNDRMINNRLTDGEKGIVASIESALRKFPRYSGRIYRNLQFKTEEQYNAFLAEYAEGETVPLKAFTSTSKLPNGYPVFGNGVVHLVVDCETGCDIADTYGLIRQQEVILLPGTELKVTKVMTANDGNPLIFTQEVVANAGNREGYEGNSGYRESERGVYRTGDAQGIAPGRRGEDSRSVQREVWRDGIRDGVQSKRGESAEAGNVPISDSQFSLKDSGITMTQDEYLGLHDVQYNLKAEESHKAALKKNFSPANAVVSRDALMARYEKTLEIWKRLSGELNSKFLEDWNNKTDRVFTIFKAQSGYKYNVELSSMCKKGVPLFEAIDTIVKQEVMRELKLDVLGKAEKEVLYDILKQHNFEIPCAICYVEQARQREGVIIDAFLNGSTEDGKSKLGWNTVLDDIETEMKANGVEYKFQNVSRSIATEKYTPADIAMDEKTLAAFHAAVQKLANKEIRRYNKEEGKNRRLLKNVTPEAVNACFKGSLPSNLKLFKTLLTEPSSRFRIGKDLLYSSMTTMNLSALHNGLYGLFNAQGGVSGYKTKQGTTIYWGELLGKRWSPDTVRREGGIRQQSNSDFQMFTFLDKAQMYIDHSAKGYYVQEYSKVLAELKLFGLSGAKLNASLIPAVVEYKNADGSVDVERTMLTAGLDEYGNPIYDDIEGVNHAEAFMLLEDPNYSRSLCGICIGYSDKHIEKLLDDPRVQMIIGFHDKTNDPDKRYRGARYAKNYNGLNEAVEDNGAGKTKHIGFNPYIQKAEKLFTRNESTKRFEGTATFGGKQYVANDIPRLAADMYLADCAKKGYRPAYNDFTGHPNYYKLLSDIGLYDSLGQYAPHEKVAYKLPDKVPYLDKSGNKRFMATEKYIKTELQKELAVRDSIAEALADTSENGIIPQFKAAVKEMRGDETQHSLKDSDYMKAVDSGDMETAQKMVDEAARRNGYTPVSRYHQTAGGFTKFSTANPRAGLNDSETPNGIFFKDNDHDIGLDGKTQLRAYLKADTMLHFRNREEANKWYCDNVAGYASLQDEYNAALKPFLDQLDEIEKKMFDAETTDDEYDALSVREEEIIEEMRDVENTYRGQLRELLNAHFLSGKSGYDGIELDYDGHRWVNGKREDVHTYIVFDSSQAKSADPVTYDDNGNVIPLSKRFDSSNDDIRYSLKGERDLRKEYERIRKEGEMAGKTEEEIEAEITSVVWPQYQEMIKTFGEMKRGERPAREIQVPEKSEEDRKVSQTIRNVLEAEVTPESAIPTIEQMVTQGDFSYDVITDKAAMDAAKKYIRTNKYPTALANWLSEVRAGKVSKANTALGWELYNQAATSGDLDTAITILDEMVKHQRNAAQAVQASRILKKLSPDAQLYSAVKSVQKLEEDINEKRKPKKKGADKAAKEVGEAKKDAADAAKNAHKGVRGVRKGGGLAIDSNQAGEPFVFEYAQKVGEAVAKGLEAGQNRVEKERTFLQQITAELKRFAEEKMPKKEGKKALTAVDLLRSYVQNQEFFADAWQYAQEELREKYADDPAFSEFLNTGIGVDANTNPQNAIFMRALVKAAADSGEGKAVLRRQSALGFTGMTNTIADNLIQQTGAKGEMADTIRDAAHAYVLSTLKEDGKADADIVASSVRAAMSDIGIKISDVVMSGTGEAAKQAIVDKLVDKYGIGLVEATNTAEVVAESFDQMCREFSQRRLEAMFKERKVTRKTIQEKFEQLARLGAFDIGSAYNQRAAERIFREGVKITIDEGLARKFLEAKTQEERDSIMADIYRDVGRQMPSTFIDKWNAWRYLSMLGNFRTHGRNLAGNAFFAPIVLTKDMTATGIEAAVNFVTRGKVGRTKAIPTAELLKAAWADYANIADEIMAGGKYSDTAVMNQHIEEGRRIFGRAEDARTGVGRLVSNPLGKGVEFARRKNSEALEVEDKWFAHPHYAFALAQYCKANGVTADQLRRGKALGNARAYAIKEAQKATYRDTNALSETVSALGRYNGDNMVKKGLSVVVEGILPFRKTPANILARGIEYSPIGLVKSITWDLVRVKNGDITAAEMIDNLSSGLTGTGLLALGAWLAAEGLIRGRGGDDDEEKEFEELQGHQAYSLELPDGTSMTLDWLAPESLPFFVGVNLYEMTRDNKGDATLSDILTAVSNVTEPMLEMSCLQSLNDIFESVGYASSNDMDPLPAVLTSAATSYLTQGVPTIFGQTERSTESVRMTTYPEKNAFLTTGIQRTLGKISAKTPGWDYQQIPYIDAWGRTESTGNPVANVANNFLNPAYTSQIETSAMEEELARLYDATGEASVFPSRADKYFTVDEERKDLTAQEYVKYATEKGQQSYKVVTALTKSDAYKSMTDFDRVKAIDLAYDYANAVAKTKVSKYAPEGWIAKAIATNKSTGLSPDKYIPLYMAQKGIESLKDSDGDPISNSSGLQVMQLVYNAKGLTTEQRRALFDDFGVGKSIIHYNPALVNAKLEKMRKKK